MLHTDPALDTIELLKRIQGNKKQYYHPEIIVVTKCVSTSVTPIMEQFSVLQETTPLGVVRTQRTPRADIVNSGFVEMILLVLGTSEHSLAALAPFMSGGVSTMAFYSLETGKGPIAKNTLICGRVTTPVLRDIPAKLDHGEYFYRTMTWKVRDDILLGR